MAIMLPVSLAAVLHGKHLYRLRSIEEANPVISHTQSVLDRLSIL